MRKVFSIAEPEANALGINNIHSITGKLCLEDFEEIDDIRLTITAPGDGTVSAFTLPLATKSFASSSHYFFESPDATRFKL